MAAINVGWTPAMLRNVAMALDIMLARVPEESVRNTAVADQWHTVYEWTQTVRQFTNQPDDAIPLDKTPPFPLTSQELRALEASIDRIAQARSATSSTRAGGTAHHVRHSLKRLSWSSYILGALLVAGVIGGAINIALLQLNEEQSPWLVALSLAGPCLALIVWLWHRHQLVTHRLVLEQAGHA